MLFSYVFVIMKSRESKDWGVFFIDEREMDYLNNFVRNALVKSGA